MSETSAQSKATKKWRSNHKTKYRIAQRKATQKWRSSHKKQYRMSSYYSRCKYFIKHCTDLDKLTYLRLMILKREVFLIKKTKKF